MVDSIEDVEFANSENVDLPEMEEVLPAKKRGRPPKPNKVVKIPSGRGRGRPKKYEDGDEVPVYVNNFVPREPYSGRGRPRKVGKPKLLKTIIATGKGRGRPKTVKSNISSGVGKLVVLKKSTKSKGQRGRPKKSSSSDDEENEESEEEKRPVGRPSTGAVSLNIAATGKGQGRPKKSATKRSLSGDNNEQPRKRGRPSLGKTVKTKSDKPRGRPKKDEPVEVNPTTSNESGDDDITDLLEPIKNDLE